MNEMYCPNCNGELYISDDKTQMICKHCDSVFPITEKLPNNANEQICNAESNPENELLPAERLFSISAYENLNDKAGEALGWLCAGINDGYTVDGFINEIDKISAVKSSDIYTNNERSELLHTVQMRVADQFEREETSLFFVNQGLLSRVKDGFLVTNKAVYKITKKKTFRLKFTDFCSLLTDPEPITSSIWFFNGDENFRFYTCGCTEKGCGILLGLICTLARDCHSKEYKITLGNMKK